MIIKIFRENQLFILLLSLLISVMVWIRVGFYDNSIPDLSTTYLSSFFYLFPALKSINNLRAICVLLNIFLLILNGSYLSRISVKYQLIPIRTSFPIFIMYIVSMPFFSRYNGFSYSLISLLGLLVVINLLFATIENKGISYRYFDCALLLAFLSFINFYVIFYIIFVLFVLIQLRGFRWRELLFILFGTLIPYIFLIALLYLFNGDVQGWFSSFKALFTTKTVLVYPDLIYGISIFSGLLFIVSSYWILRNYVKMKIVTRKYALIIFGLFVLTLCVLLFYPALNIDFIFFIALPVSFLFSYYFATCAINIFNQILFAIFLGFNLAVLLF